MNHQLRALSWDEYWPSAVVTYKRLSYGQEFRSIDFMGII